MAQYGAPTRPNQGLASRLANLLCDYLLVPNWKV